MVALPTTAFYWRVKDASADPHAETDWTLDADGAFSPSDGQTVQVVSVGATQIGEITADTTPTISGLADLAAAYGASVTINAAASASGTNLVYSLTGPDWLAIDSGSGSITGTAPNADESGTVTVTVSNAGGTASDTLAYTVSDVVVAPDPALVVAYDPSDATSVTGDPVDSIASQTATALLLTSTSTQRPTIGTQNSLDVLDFDGVNDNLGGTHTAPLVTASQGVTLVVAGNIASLDDGAYLLSLDSDAGSATIRIAASNGSAQRVGHMQGASGALAQFGPNAITGAQIFVLSWDGSTLIGGLKLWTRGQEYWGQADAVLAADMERVRLAGTALAPMGGSIFEARIYDGPCSAAFANAQGAELATKFGITWTTTPARLYSGMQPTDFGFGWWLDPSGLTFSSGNLVSVSTLGAANPALVPKAGHAITEGANGGLLFPSATGPDASVVYEGSPLAKTDDFTAFCVFDRTRTDRNETVLGDFFTVGDKRAWTLGVVDAGGQTVFHSDDGLATGAVTREFGAATLGRQYIAVRKVGTVMHFAWNGIDQTATVDVATHNSGNPVTIGGWGGLPAGNRSGPFGGEIEHAGFYNFGLSDADWGHLQGFLGERL